MKTLPDTELKLANNVIKQLFHSSIWDHGDACVLKLALGLALSIPSHLSNTRPWSIREISKFILYTRQPFLTLIIFGQDFCVAMLYLLHFSPGPTGMRKDIILKYQVVQSQIKLTQD